MSRWQAFSGQEDRIPRRNRKAQSIAQPPAKPSPPTTPDGRYFVVRGRLWRCTNPHLDPEKKALLVAYLMAARRAKGVALRRDDREGSQQAKAAIDEAKRALGERGPVWWRDGAPDWNRHLVKNSPYADWFLEACRT